MYSIENKTWAKFRECFDECNKHKRRSQKMSNDMMIWHWHVWHIFLLILYSFIGIKIAPTPHVMSGAGSSNSKSSFHYIPVPYYYYFTLIKILILNFHTKWYYYFWVWVTTWKTQLKNIVIPKIWFVTNWFAVILVIVVGLFEHQHFHCWAEQ